MLEVDKAHSGAVLAEDVGHLWQPRVRKKVSPGSHSLLASLPPSAQGRGGGGGKNTCAGGRDLAAHLSHLNPAARGSSPIGPRGHVVLGNDRAAVSC